MDTIPLSASSGSDFVADELDEENEGEAAEMLPTRERVGNHLRP